MVYTGNPGADRLSGVHTALVFKSAGPAGRRERDVHCPFCRNPDSRVIDSRSTQDEVSAIRRRQSSERGFTTQESVIQMLAKRSGVTEPFLRRRSSPGCAEPARAARSRKTRSRSSDSGWKRPSGRPDSPRRSQAHEIGLAILGPLQELDEVAYLRFASVYRGFESLDDFEKEIESLREIATPD